MRRFFLLLTALTLALHAPAASAADGKLTVVATVFPAYDWTRVILGERAGQVRLKLLFDNGVDLHSYQPTVNDMILVSSCDLFVGVGGASDNGLSGALSGAVNQRTAVIDLLASLGERAREEVPAAGETPEHHHHDHEHEEPELDEHVWLSLRHAQRFCRLIAEKLAALDPEGAPLYRANAAAYAAQLQALDGEYAAMIASAKRRTVVFADRFPFIYMTEDYGLEHYAAFRGCSAESEASFKTLAVLAGKVKELDLPAVLVLENSDRKIAATVLRTAGGRERKIVVMNSMQSCTARDLERGTTSLSLMRDNLAALREALN
ncbi:metal ABC transporter substrate-binding protein [Pyramidobacter porci]